MHLSVRDAARILNVSEKTIYRWVQQGALPAYKVNEQYRFHRAELLEWATAKRLNVSPEIVEEPHTPGSALPTLAAALEAGGIAYRVGGTDKDTVLKAVVRELRLPEEVDREFLLRVLLAREALGSTAVGDGIAIPHVRNPIVLHVPRPAVTLCFLEKPVEFGALDRKPVHTLFTLVSPTVRAHLHLISRLAYVLRDPAAKEAVLRQESRETILERVRRAEGSLVASAPTGTHG
ncbi:MAG: PTS sugar transporter subunit IIA [Planctomycetales bacterium]|nr:PTS sugar transporter subunit IIA [Planctomycetales bacterium]